MKDLHGLRKTCNRLEKRQVAGIVKGKGASRPFSDDVVSDVEESSSGTSKPSRDEQLEELYAQLGRVLFERTKGIEEYYLLAPELYLAIERIDSET